MIDNLRIFSPTYEGEVDTIVELLDSDERRCVAEQIRKNDGRWGFNLDKNYHYINNYENDDYLFGADLLERVRNIHKKIYFNPYYKTWIRGHSEIPYIHLKYVETPAFKTDNYNRPILDNTGNLVPDDKKLNMGVKPPFFNKTHVLEFNYYWLKQYIRFLHRVFDSNEEVVLTLPNDRKIQPRYGTKEQIYKLANDVELGGYKEQAHKLRIYASGSICSDQLQIPELIFYRKSSGTEIVDWGFVSRDGRDIKLPMVKGIYNTSGFAPLFHNRNDVIAEIFTCSMEMILAHEVAHVARGHWNLRISEPDFSKERNVMMNCEIQADSTAMLWLLNELLYDTAIGDPNWPVLAYKKDVLIFLWSVRIFSAYLSLSWGFREEERVWSVRTIEDFIADRNKTHPPYQFRVYSILCHAKKHLDHMAEQCKKHNYTLKTYDGYPLNEDLFEQVWVKTMDMVYSFEESFKMSWVEDERSTEQKLRDGVSVAIKSVPDNIKEIPFMMGYMNKAQEEMAGYEELWPTVLDKLRKYGMYFVM